MGDRTLQDCAWSDIDVAVAIEITGTNDGGKKSIIRSVVYKKVTRSGTEEFESRGSRPCRNVAVQQSAIKLRQDLSAVDHVVNNRFRLVGTLLAEGINARGEDLDHGWTGGNPISRQHHGGRSPAHAVTVAGDGGVSIHRYIDAVIDIKGRVIDSVEGHVNLHGIDRTHQLGMLHALVGTGIQGIPVESLTLYYITVEYAEVGIVRIAEVIVPCIVLHMTMHRDVAECILGHDRRRNRNSGRCCRIRNSQIEDGCRVPQREPR